MIRVFAIVPLCAVLLCPASAEAQNSSAPLVNPEGLTTVFVLDSRGAEYRGKLMRVDADELVVLVNGDERRFLKQEIVRVDKRGDPLKNGALIGAAVGVAMGLLAAGISDCPAPFQESCPGARVGLVVTSIGLYAAVGTGIDAAIRGRTRIYERRPEGRAALRPSMAFSVRW